MDPGISVELAIASLVLVAAVIVGRRAAGGIGAFILGVAAALASASVVIGTWFGLHFGESTGGWIGLSAGVALSILPIWGIARQFLRGQSHRFLVGLWLAFCALCLFGYLAGGWVGLLTITLPAILIFWILLFRISAHILPLRDRNSQHRQAFRTLLTFTMGTNYPYYFVEDGKVEKRIDGNPYGQFFAGPGLIYTGCDHAAYVHDGIHVKGAFSPGLSFTGMFDLKPKALDLRTQLRAFNVDALTQDGIPIRVLVFNPFRVIRGNQEVELKKSFPFRRTAVFDIVRAELAERHRRTDKTGQRLEWDGELVPAITTPIVQDIISYYTVDELCAPLDPDRDPRVEIAAEMRKRVRAALLPRGIELVGGGISNLNPLDDTIIERRLDNWKTEWERQFLLHLSQGKVERTRQIERARAAAEAEIALTFGRMLGSTLDDNASQAALALRFIDCVGEIVSNSDTQWPLPKGVEETLKCLRGELEEGQR